MMPFSVILIPLLMHGLNLTPQEVIYVNSQSEWTHQYYCYDFAKDLRDELRIMGYEAYVIRGQVGNYGHYWVVYRANQTAQEDASFTVIEPRFGKDVTDNMEFEPLWAQDENYQTNKKIMEALI